MVEHTWRERHRDVDAEGDATDRARTDGGTDAAVDAGAFEWQTDPWPPAEDPSQKD
jgi:hypothetical protein